MFAGENRAVALGEMLDARERRAAAQREMIERHGLPLVSFTLNVPGPVKDSALLRRAFDEGLRQIGAVLLAEQIETVQRAETRAATGCEALLAVRAGALRVKRALCAIEEKCAIGRYFDIDVIDTDGAKISRVEAGAPERRCFLCGKPAAECARSRTHSAAELQTHVFSALGAFLDGRCADQIAERAVRALLYEVAVTPKPGLVDRANAGAHDDMDFFTFQRSAAALTAYFRECALSGLHGEGRGAAERFDDVKFLGVLAERDMLEATGGVNTHKGAIFSLGIACASLGMGYGAPLRVHKTLARCGEMTGAQMRRELEAAKGGQARTFGEAIYQKAGVGGVRAEAASGFASVREIALPRLNAGLKAGLSLNDAALCALTALMADTQDTNAVRRGGEAGAAAMRETARALDGEIAAALEAGEMKQKIGQFKEKLTDWDGQMSAAGISPGGCADLLAMALLMAFCERDAAET